MIEMLLQVLTGNQFL